MLDEPVTGETATPRALLKALPDAWITPVVFAFRDTSTASEATPTIASPMTDSVSQNPPRSISFSYQNVLVVSM
jgi:hypothetical protein